MKIKVVLAVFLFTTVWARDQENSNQFFNRFVVVIASRNNSAYYKRNLDSVFMQDYPRTRVRIIYSDDSSTDGTAAAVQQYIDERKAWDQVTMVCTCERRYALANQYTAIWSCHDDEIVIILDGDDALRHTQVLSYLNKIYTPDIWLTYGQYCAWPSGAIGFCKAYPQRVIDNNAFRDYPDTPSHLRSFRVALFKKIKKEDLLYKGSFFTMTSDMAMMLPMIEMARNGHFVVIPDVLYSYNEDNPCNDHRTSKAYQRECDLEIRSRRRYEALEHL